MHETSDQGRLPPPVPQQQWQPQQVIIYHATGPLPTDPRVVVGGVNPIRASPVGAVYHNISQVIPPGCVQYRLLPASECPGGYYQTQQNPGMFVSPQDVIYQQQQPQPQPQPQSQSQSQQQQQQQQFFEQQQNQHYIVHQNAGLHQAITPRDVTQSTTTGAGGGLVMYSRRKDTSRVSSEVAAAAVNRQPVPQRVAFNRPSNGLELRPTDVLFGRGVRTNKHPGNEHFRKIVTKYENVYRHAHKKAHKSQIAKAIIAEIGSLNPPGRFVESCRGDGRRDANGDYVEYRVVNMQRAHEKVTQHLRDRHKCKEGLVSASEDEEHGEHVKIIEELFPKAETHCEVYCRTVSSSSTERKSNCNSLSSSISNINDGSQREESAEDLRSKCEVFEVDIESDICKKRKLTRVHINQEKGPNTSISPLYVNGDRSDPDSVLVGPPMAPSLNSPPHDDTSNQDYKIPLKRIQDDLSATNPKCESREMTGDEKSKETHEESPKSVRDVHYTRMSKTAEEDAARELSFLKRTENRTTFEQDHGTSISSDSTVTELDVLHNGKQRTAPQPSSSIDITALTATSGDDLDHKYDARKAAVRAAAAEAADMFPESLEEVDALLCDEGWLLKKLKQHTTYLLRNDAWELLEKIGFYTSSKGSGYQHKDIYQKGDGDDMVVKTYFALEDIPETLVEVGIPSVEKLNPIDRLHIELWVRHVAVLDDQLFRSVDGCVFKFISMTEDDLCWWLSRIYGCQRDNTDASANYGNIIEPCLLEHAGKMYFLNCQNGCDTPPAYSLNQLRARFRKEGKLRLLTDKVNDVNKRLAIQLWLASSPEPLPIFRKTVLHS